MSRSPGLGFFLFILLNAALFIRPVDLVPSLEGAPIHNALMLSGLAVSAGAVLGQLRSDCLVSNPIHASVLCLLVSIVLSRVRQSMLDALGLGFDFIKTLCFYFLLVAVVDSLPRMRAYLFWLCLFVAVLTSLAVLHYYGMVSIPALDAYHEGQDEIDEDTGLPIVIARLQSVGFYNNPNDLARILVTGILIALYFLGDRRIGMLRPLWILPIVLFGLALQLTHSRGGLLALFGGLATLFYTRFGRKKTILLSLIIFPTMLILFGGGRQTNFSTSGGTAQDRIKIWSDGLVLMRSSPIFGIGADQYAKEVGLAAHNSFVHCYVEVGLVGGTFFFATLYLPLRALFSLNRDQATRADPELVRLRPFVLAILAATGVGMLSSTRSYTITSYVIIGLCAAYLRILSDQGQTLLPRLDAKLVRRLAFLSVLTLAGFSTYVRLNARY
jgi:hypothetical protein